MRFCLLPFAFLLVLPVAAPAQPVTDTLFVWRGYGRSSSCRVQVFPAAGSNERTHAVVLRELAENRGPSILEDARYLVEQVGRSLDLDPAEVFWVFHWGAFSYEGANGRKDLFLRATFRRNKGGSLTTPTWRVVSREEVEELTDRRFR